MARPSRGLSHLKSIRDYFAHPRPMLSIYEESFLVDAFSDTIDVIRQVSNLPGHRASQHDPEEAALILNSIKYYLTRWETAIETSQKEHL